MNTPLLALADRCEASDGADNRLDVLIEVALFKPDERHVSIRANSAGTKVIYTTAEGAEQTFWAHDWTKWKTETAIDLRARAQGEG